MTPDPSRDPLADARRWKRHADLWVDVWLVGAALLAAVGVWVAALIRAGS